MIYRHQRIYFSELSAPKDFVQQDDVDIPCFHVDRQNLEDTENIGARRTGAAASRILAGIH